ncbi:MAG: MurR/RpiR family transcriptional regulator [Rhodobacteraceae bacterium]|nr:MurR/RpiR family transcriptional regulator [Paracoccaceae bacterium]
MPAATLIEDRISEHYSGLSTKLRTAADYVAENPVDLATRSLRSVAGTSGVSPATFSRLARVLGFDDYEEMREAGRVAVGNKLVPFSERAQTLRQSGNRLTAAGFLHQQAETCITNIRYLDQNISGDRLERAADALYRAKKVWLVGAKGSAGIVDYLGYQAQWFARDWIVTGRHGVSAASALAQMRAGDVVLVLTKSPYARQSIKALQQAADMSLTTIVLTDSHTSPALQFADHSFVVPTETPSFFSSYAATLVIVEAMLSILLTKIGPEAESRIRETEEQVRRLDENWSE